MPLVSKGGLSFSFLRSSDGCVPHSGMQRNALVSFARDREREREDDKILSFVASGNGV